MALYVGLCGYPSRDMAARLEAAAFSGLRK
jgi:hypothetical protein